MQVRGFTLAFKLNTDVTRSPNTGISGLTKRTDVLPKTVEFFLNVFNEFTEFSDKKIVITVKGFKPATQPLRV